MSIRILGEVLDYAPVEKGTLLVLIALANNADTETRTCYPGIPSIATKSRLKTRQVQNCIRNLMEAGIVLIQRGGSHVGTNLYTITPVEMWAEAILPGGAKIASPVTISNTFNKPDAQSLHPRDAMGCTPDTQPIAPKPSDNRQVKPSDSNVMVLGDPDFFDLFWKAYPHNPGRRNKAAAKKTFLRIIAKKVVDLEYYPDAHELVAAAENYAAEIPDRNYVPGAEVWLNKSRWFPYVTGQQAKKETRFSKYLDPKL